MSFSLPPFLPMVRRALPRLLEGTIAPVVLFYLGFLVGDLLGGLVASLAWAYGAVAVRLLRGQRVTGLLALSLVALTGRSLAALGTGSVFFYFLQPTLGTFLTAGVFLVSAATKRPLTRRLSADLVDLPDHITAHPGMDRLHVSLSVLWGVTFAVSGGLALWLLVSQSLGTFLMVKFAASGGLMAVAVAASTMMFFRFVRSQREQPASVAT
jgi:hypothetical protein